jgi:hypothetical protein
VRERRWGRIVAISSAMVHAGSPGALHHVASTGGIVGFIRSPARDQAHRPAEDLTGAPSYLVSDEAGFVTGWNRVVDGGSV